MTDWPWLREQLDTGWPTHCPRCGTTLEVSWLTTTSRRSDGAARPGVGLTCRGCSREFDWSDEGRYDLRARPFRLASLGPDRRLKG